MALLEMLGLGALLLAGDIKDNIEDKRERKLERQKELIRESERARNKERERERAYQRQIYEEKKREKSEREQRQRIVAAVPKRPIYNTSINYRCSICGGNRKLDLPNGLVICPHCDSREGLEIIRYENDYHAMDLALKEYEEKKKLEKKLDEEKKRLEAIERQKEADAEISRDMLNLKLFSVLMFVELGLLAVWVDKNNAWPMILCNSIAISGYIIYKKGLIKTVLMYTVFLPFVILVWIFDKYLNMKQIGIAVGVVITMLVDILVVLLLIEWIFGGI
ncbi:MAG TPA: hypothetical protein DCX21_07045 [Eubacterium sp.]|nr:hypothetical protein [Eubacterium sp.]